jgi:hypothetical protein
MILFVRHWRFWRFLFATALAVGCAGQSVGAASYDGKLTVAAVDAQTRQSLAVRMDLRDARGRAVRVRPEGAVVAGESIYFDGEATLELRRGAYSFVIEAGPEYITRPGHFTLDRHAEDATEVQLNRRVDMRAEGWWAGDLDVQMPLASLPLAMRARGVDFAPVAAIVNDQGRCRKLKAAGTADQSLTPPLFGPWATLDERRGGGLIVIGGEPPVDPCQWKADEPSLPMAIAADEAGAVLTARSSSAWDFPVWIAAGKLDAVQIISPRLPVAAKLDHQRPHDEDFFPGKLGAGRYHEAIYHKLLDCGVRLAPAAGSAAGAGSGRTAVASPLGANRVYVQCGETCTRDAWLAGLKAGQCCVTNGPLLRVSVEDQPPGHVFSIDQGERREFQIALNLAFYEQTQVEYLEIIQNGRSTHQIRLAELAARSGRLPPVEFTGSGWFLVRAVTNNAEFYQFATTGPYYVESNYEPRISRASVQFFIDWLDEAARKFAGNQPVVAELDAARPFWQKLMERANVE